MKILLLGKSGLLGSALFSVLQEEHILAAPTHAECDVTKREDLELTIKNSKPEIVINATGYTAVDRAETEKDLAFALNKKAVQSLVSLLKPSGTPLIHFSTDYVFDGEKADGYKENDKPNPISTYGESKLAGENAVTQALQNFYLIRTAWIFGEGGKNFVDTMLALGAEDDPKGANRAGGEEKPLRVVSDQIGNPTYSLDLAQAVLRLLESKNYGIYHIVNSGICSWYEFAVSIFEILGVPKKIEPITTKELNRPAKRPAHSILLNTKLPSLRHWKEALASYLQPKTLIL